MTDCDPMTYGDLETETSRDVPGVEARRRTIANVPPGLLHALEMRPDTTRIESSFVKRGTFHDTILTRSSPLHTPTSAVAAADAGTSFTFGAQRGAPQGYGGQGQGRIRDVDRLDDFDAKYDQRGVQRVMYDDLRYDDEAVTRGNSHASMEASYGRRPVDKAYGQLTRSETQIKPIPSKQTSEASCSRVGSPADPSDHERRRVVELQMTSHENAEAMLTENRGRYGGRRRNGEVGATSFQRAAVPNAGIGRIAAEALVSENRGQHGSSRRNEEVVATSIQRTARPDTSIGCLWSRGLDWSVPTVDAVHSSQIQSDRRQSTGLRMSDDERDDRLMQSIRRMSAAVSRLDEVNGAGSDDRSTPSPNMDLQRLFSPNVVHVQQEAQALRKWSSTSRLLPDQRCTAAVERDGDVCYSSYGRRPRVIANNLAPVREYRANVSNKLNVSSIDRAREQIPVKSVTRTEVDGKRSADEQSIRSSIESGEEVQLLLEQCKAELAKLDKRAAEIQRTPPNRGRRVESSSKLKADLVYESQPIPRRRLLMRPTVHGDMSKHMEDTELSMLEERASSSYQLGVTWRTAELVGVQSNEHLIETLLNDADLLRD